MIIRDIREEDKCVFLEMGKEFYNSPACDHVIPERAFEATWEECLRSRDYARILLLEEEKEMAGYLLLALTWSNEAGGLVVWLEELYLRERFRGKGYGTEVFAWVEQEYAHAKRFRLEVARENEKAAALYQRLGYERMPYVPMVKEEK